MSFMFLKEVIIHLHGLDAFFLDGLQLIAGGDHGVSMYVDGIVDGSWPSLAKLFVDLNQPEVDLGG
jgi:hypothetical protein